MIIDRQLKRIQNITMNYRKQKRMKNSRLRSQIVNKKKLKLKNKSKQNKSDEQQPNCQKSITPNKIISYKNSYLNILNKQKKRIFQYCSFNLQPFYTTHKYEYLRNQKCQQILNQLEDWNHFIIMKIQEVKNHYEADILQKYDNGCYFHKFQAQNYEWQKYLQVWKLQSFFSQIYQILQQTLYMTNQNKSVAINKISELLKKWIKPESDQKSKQQQQQIKIQMNTIKLHHNLHNHHLKPVSNSKIKQFKKIKNSFRASKSQDKFTSVKYDQMRKRIHSLCANSTQKMKNIVKSASQQIKKQAFEFTLKLNKRKSVIQNKSANRKLVIGITKQNKQNGINQINKIDTQNYKFSQFVDIVGINLINQQKINNYNCKSNKNKHGFPVKFQKGSLKFNTKSKNLPQKQSFLPSFTNKLININTNQYL